MSPLQGKGSRATNEIKSRWGTAVSVGHVLCEYIDYIVGEARNWRQNSQNVRMLPILFKGTIVLM